MKIFLDTAEIKAIEKWKSTGLIDGVTTNPTHLFKEGGSPIEVVKKICTLLPDGDISVEVTEKDPDAVFQQAVKISKLGTNVVVKVPCHASYYEVIRKLVEQGVRVNITLLFSLPQALMMAKMGVAYISPFIGRIDDTDGDGIALVRDAVQMMLDYQFSTQVLAASVRSIKDFHEIIMARAHAVTLPIAVFEKALEHPLTDKGMQLFDEDWKKLGVKQFP